MTQSIPKSGLQLRSTVTRDGRLEISLDEVATPEPGPDDLVVRVGKVGKKDQDVVDRRLHMLEGDDELAELMIGGRLAAGRHDRLLPCADGCTAAQMI